MQVSWLIEAAMFPDYQATFIEQIQRQGHQVKVVPELAWGYRWDDVGSPYLKLFPQDACVVFHGSIELASRLAVQARWVPGVYATWGNYDCSLYYCHFSKYLLNADYVMVPFGELLRRKQFLFDLFAKDSAIFVRPNSVQKSFTGQLAKWETYEKDVEFMAFYDVPPEAIVLVSSPKVVTHEWRFVIADRRVVSGSQYKLFGKLENRSQVEPAAQSLAEEIAAQKFQPDRVWTLDICKTATDEFHMLEIGSFSASDLYACDMGAVVREVSKVAAADWQAAHNE